MVERAKKGEKPPKEEKKGETQAPKKRKKPKIIIVSARRKMAVAQATVREGKMIFRINGLRIEVMQNPYTRDIISEPLTLASDYVKNLNIDVTTSGGGAVGQAQAARSAIARAIIAWTGDEGLKRDFLTRDRYLLVEDQRQVEPKKYKGPKARARFQKSYR